MYIQSLFFIYCNEKLLFFYKCSAVYYTKIQCSLLYNHNVRFRSEYLDKDSYGRLLCFAQYSILNRL